ncbi:ABC transporter permease [Litorisediminicola beolgyonensis]|uniref:ABC transporter permease n=1 Tax=Litorisediminicola beolgyonensis TaxID=1173614 RepID=A0ABW3ZIW1_9RHOB
MLAISFFRQSSGGFYEPVFTLDNFGRFLSPFFAKVLTVSVSFSAGAAAIAVAIAFPFTYLLVQMSGRAQAVALVFLLSVLSLSEVIIGFSWSTILSQTAGIGNILAGLGLISESRSFSPSSGALLTALVYLGFPYSVLVIYPAMSRLDPEIPEAARMCGASPVRTFFTTVVPMMRNTITGALILVFVFTLGAYILPQTLGRPQDWTLSVHITDQAVFQSNLPFASAMSIFLLLVSLALVGLSMLLGQTETKR